MASWACLDAGVALKLVLNEPDSQQAKALWKTLVQEGYQLAAPHLFTFEITSVLRRNVHRGKITPEYGMKALNYLLRLDIQLLTTKDIHVQAWTLATRLNRPDTYDACYFALAKHLECDFWTADKRLFNATSHHLSWIRYLGDF